MYPETNEVLITLIQETSKILTLVLLAACALGCLAWMRTTANSQSIPESPSTSAGSEVSGEERPLTSARDQHDLLQERESKAPTTRVREPSSRNISSRTTEPPQYSVNIQNDIEINGDVNIHHTKASNSHTKVRQTTAFTPNLDTRRPPSSHERARKAFGDGMHKFWSGRNSAALQQFHSAHELDATNASPLYFRALAQLRSGRGEMAEETLARAIEVESKYPITLWGRLMERVQGRQRLWIEDARLKAGL